MKLAEGITPPRPGQTRFSTWFAWLPQYVGNARVWLERYEVMEAYLVTRQVVIVEDKQIEITSGEWKLVSTRLKKRR